MTQDIADSLGLKTAKGALVAQENKDAPAAAAGMKAGDVITAVNGETVDDPRDLARRIADARPEEDRRADDLRNGAQQTIDGDARRDAGRQGGDERPGGPASPTRREASVAKLGLHPRARPTTASMITDVDPDGAAAEGACRRAT